MELWGLLSVNSLGPVLEQGFHELKAPRRRQERFEIIRVVRRIDSR